MKVLEASSNKAKANAITKKRADDTDGAVKEMKEYKIYDGKLVLLDNFSGALE